MKTIKITILKKGRIWFDCKNEKGYACKLKINEFSKDLTLGDHEILVKDISIRSSYGTDLRFYMAGEKSKEKVFITHFKFNSQLVDECKELGGVWDAESKSWVFSSIVKDKVEELEEKYNGDLVSIEIEAIEYIGAECESIRFLGYPIAKATGRDSGAVLGHEVYQIQGSISSGGSCKNWSTNISKNSKFRLQVPKNLLDIYKENITRWNVIEIVKKKGKESEI